MDRNNLQQLPESIGTDHVPGIGVSGDSEIVGCGSRRQQQEQNRNYKSDQNHHNCWSCNELTAESVASFPNNTHRTNNDTTHPQLRHQYHQNNTSFLGTCRKSRGRCCGLTNGMGTQLVIGFLLLQSANLCNATSQLYNTAAGLSDSYNTGVSGSRISSTSSSSSSHKEPLFLTQSAAFKFVVGETITLPCEVTNPAAYVLAWKRGIAILTAGNVKVTPDPRVQLSSGYSLQIKDAGEQDAGDYICQIATIDPREITHHVEILVPPKIKHVTSGGHLQVKKGSPVRLECSASGNPQPNITWTRKNNVLPNGEDKYVSPTYVIEKMDRHKGGVYICTANNGVGHIATNQINLHVLFPPEVSVENSLVYSGEREEATLSCTVHGETPPEVFWYKDTMQILPTDRITMEDSRGAKHSLIIHRVIPSDFGNYSCVASNLLGKERKTVTLTGRPHPVVFQSQSVSQWRDKYNISWTVKSVSPIDEYFLYYRSVSGGPLTHHYEMQRVRQSYSASLALGSSPGQSSLSNNDPYLNSNRLQEQHPGLYNSLSFGSSGGFMQNEWMNITLPSFAATKKSFNGMSYVLRNLEPDTQYEARIKARNRYGWSDESQSMFFSTASTESEVLDLGVTFYSAGQDQLLGMSRANGFLMLLGVCFCFTFHHHRLLWRAQYTVTG